MVWVCLLSIVGSFSVIASLQTSRRFASSSTVDCGCGSLAAQNHLVTLETLLILRRLLPWLSWVFAQARNSRLQAVDTHYPPPSQPASCANFTDVLISFHKSRPQIKMPFVCKLSVEILFACSHTFMLQWAALSRAAEAWVQCSWWKLVKTSTFQVICLKINFHSWTNGQLS